MSLSPRIKWIALSLWEGYSSRSLRLLMQHLPDPLTIFDEPERITSVLDTGRKILPPFVPEKLLDRADKELRRADIEHFKILTITDPEFSGLLKTIPHPPIVLYYRGDVRLFQAPCISIVGTRRPTRYGLEVTRQLSKELVNHQLSIVSGLALGIDVEAHRGAIEGKGTTIAVLGAGLDQKYPATNHKVRLKIEEIGLVLSEFPWGTPPNPSHFPGRNRIISGLSLGTVLVEARKKSGALITVNHALDQGRDVFAVPGPITSPPSYGPLLLIQQGAIPVLSVEDILSHVPMIQDQPKKSPARDQACCRIPDEIDTAWTPLWQLLNSEPTGVDTLISQTDWDASKVHTILLDLELKGLVQQLPGKRYILSPSDIH